jgi:hypothetical protein
VVQAARGLGAEQKIVVNEGHCGLRLGMSR